MHTVLYKIKEGNMYFPWHFTGWTAEGEIIETIKRRDDAIQLSTPMQEKLVNYTVAFP